MKKIVKFLFLVLLIFLLTGCSKKEYNVVFKDYDGTVLSTMVVAEGSSAIAPQVPKKEGYTFVGWDTSFDEVKSNIEVKAKYEINQYTINFDCAGGIPVADIEANYSSIINLPRPVRENYVFLGWFDGVNTFEDQYEVKESKALSAKWILAIEYQISFDGLGNNENDSMIVFGYDYVTSLPIPTKDNLIFDGWTYLGEKIEIGRASCRERV